MADGSVLPGVMAKVPLAREDGLVAPLLHFLAKGWLVVGEVARSSQEEGPSHARMGGNLTSEQSSTRRSASWMNIEGVEKDRLGVRGGRGGGLLVGAMVSLRRG